jgi:hypothetical protein
LNGIYESLMVCRTMVLPNKFGLTFYGRFVYWRRIIDPLGDLALRRPY